MKQVLVSGGAVRVEEVPAPGVEPGTVIVRMDHSCISIGTEISTIGSSGVPFWQRALREPKNVMRVIDMVRTDGLAQTRRTVRERLSAEMPTGYSGAGVVVEVGANVVDYRHGDRVACAGAQFAFHAEFVRVPVNLVARVPDDVGLAEASSVALGAIALQGIRRATPTLGETFVVIGLGILGQLTVQMLRTNGCRVIGVDLDRTRIALATQSGLLHGIHPDDTDDVGQVMRLTDGTGADGVIITAGGPSDAIVSTAFSMCRRKGRVVLVGDVGLALNRSDLYAKELDFLVSTSYGPGRYDSRYEEGGIDYPLAYVRWTENRNMREYLRLLAEKAVDVTPLISAVYPINEAESAYRSLRTDGQRPLMVLLSYPDRTAEPTRRSVCSPRITATRRDVIQIGLIGAGTFAKGMHLPNVLELEKDYRLRAVASRTGHNAASTAKRFGAEYSTTDYQEILNDPDIDAVIIATRHDTHASIVMHALSAGKHVLVEKPLALHETELADIETFYRDGEDPKPVLLTGFNRRFSPYAERIASLVVQRSNPMIVNYRMNAGYIPLHHWVHSAEGGGRNRGEACHIYDFFTFLTNAPSRRVNASAIRPSTGHYASFDNFVATIDFEDGSVATLTYTALGAQEYPKEAMDVFVDGMVISLEEYKSMSIAGANHAGFATRSPDKGQKAELAAFARALRGSAEWPIPLWQQIQATRISFDVERLLTQEYIRCRAS